MTKKTIIIISVTTALLFVGTAAFIVAKKVVKKNGKSVSKLKPSSKILVVGDSMTNIDWSYADLLGKRGFPSITKKAKNGASTTWMKEQVQSEISKGNYSAVIMLGGYNDIVNGMNLDTTKMNIDNIVSSAKNEGASVLFITPAPAGYNKNTDSITIKSRQKKVMDMLKNSDADAVVDLYSKIVSTDNKPNLDYVLSDKEHINQKAQIIIADEIQKIIK